MGQESPRLVIHVEDGTDRVMDLREGRVEVGRAPEVAIRLIVPEVSARHAELSWDGVANLLMRDLGSTNGTYVNGRRVSDWVALGQGDRIRWGSVEAEVVLSNTGGARPSPATNPTPAQGPSAGQHAGRDTTMRPSTRRIFISHASEDKRWARYIAGALRRQGWEPWLDESDIRGGSSWAASIQAALRSSAVVVLLVTANSVAKEWVLDEIAAARNLRVPIIAAVLEHVRLPDELQFMLQRTQLVDVSGVAASSDEQNRRHAAIRSLDDAILGVLERRHELNPDRALMRIGRVLEVLGVILVLGGFAGFIYTGFVAGSEATDGFPVPVLVAFGVFIIGGVLGASGAAMVRAGRAKGL